MSDLEIILALEKQASAAAEENIQAPRLEEGNVPANHDERLAWVRQSYERFFEKVREHDALMRLVELH